MKYRLPKTVLIFLMCVALSPIFLKKVSAAYINPEVNWGDSFTILNFCDNPGPTDFYVNIPSSYTGSRAKLEASHGRFWTHIDLCADKGSNEDNMCVVDVIPGKKLEFEVTFESDEFTRYSGKCGFNMLAYGVSGGSISSSPKKPSGPVCGDGKCETGESYATCTKDCDKPKSSTGGGCITEDDCASGYCVDSVCQSFMCGNTYCEDQEDCYNCPQDCGACKKTSNLTEEVQGPGAVCGNGNCESWDGEDCQTCEKDCWLDDFCCNTSVDYILPHNFHNKIFHVQTPESGNIPEGALTRMKDVEEKFFFREGYKHYFCVDERLTEGMCADSRNCPEGLCYKNTCVGEEIIQQSRDSGEFDAVTNPVSLKELYKEQNGFKEEFLQTYSKHLDTLLSYEEDYGIRVEMEVLGYLLDDTPEVSEGDDVEVRLKIRNISKNKVGVTAGIDYTQMADSDIDEKEYSIGFEWDGGFSSFMGSFYTKLIGGKYFVMPPGSKVYVYSKVVPKTTGRLKANGYVYAASEIKHVQDSYGIGLIDTKKSQDEYEKSFKKTHLHRTVNVYERKCRFWPICL